MSIRREKRGLEKFVEVDVEDSFVLEPTQVEVGSGYTVSVSYDEDERPIIDIKTFGEVDLAKIRKEIEKIFPNAQIRHPDLKGSVTVAKKRASEIQTEKE